MDSFWNYICPSIDHSKHSLRLLGLVWLYQEFDLSRISFCQALETFYFIQSYYPCGIHPHQVFPDGSLSPGPCNDFAGRCSICP